MEKGTGRITERYGAIRRSKANMVLCGAGGFLLLMSLIWWLAVAPAIKVIPTDFDQQRSYRGTLSYHVPPVDGSMGDYPILLVQRVFSLVHLSTPETSVVEMENNYLQGESRQEIAKTSETYAMDRKTGELVEDPEAGTIKEGYRIVFPFNTPKSDVPFWSDDIGKTFPAVFRDERRLEGLDVYDYKVSFEQQPRLVVPTGYPPQLTGAELKVLFDLPELAIDESAVFEPEYTASTEIDLSVEPVSGSIVATTGYLNEVFVNISGQGLGEEASRRIYTVEYGETEGSVRDNAEAADTELKKIRLQFTYIPLGLLGFGLVTLVAGLFVGLKEPRPRKRKEKPAVNGDSEGPGDNEKKPS